jgi:hypothetical protein
MGLGANLPSAYTCVLEYMFCYTVNWQTQLVLCLVKNFPIRALIHGQQQVSRNFDFTMANQLIAHQPPGPIV